MSGSNEWPSSNPFPFSATSTTPNTSSELADPPSAGVTFPFDHVTRASDLVHDYLRSYPAKTGRVAMLNGEHGSGKSHTIRYLIDRIARGNWQQEGAPPAVKLSVKIVSADFLAAYQQLIGQIDLDLLRSVASDSKRALAAERWVDTASSDDAKGLIRDRLRTDKNAAMEALLRSLVDPDAVETQQQLEVARSGRGYEEFQRAVPFLVSKDRDMAAIAQAWLANKPVTVDDMKKLGVSGPIDSLDVAVSALQFIMILFRRAGRPLLLFVDQCEKLTKEGEATPEQRTANIGVLRQLVENVLDNSAFLLVAGTDEAWNRFSDDLQARFRTGLVMLPRLDPERTRKLMLEYLHVAEPETDSVFPFDEGAIDALFRFSRGNLRSLLQAAWVLYNDAEKQSPRPPVIDAAAVDRALAKELLQPTATVDQMKAAVEKLLLEAGLDWRPNFQIDDVTAQYAVVDSDESPVLIVQVLSAAFHDVEVQNAQRLVSAILALQRTRGTPPRVGVILGGYVSSRVLSVLGSLQSVLRTIVYDPATFRTEFGVLLAGARRVPRASGGGEEKLRADLDRVRSELQSVREQSDSKVDRLERRLQEALASRPVAVEPLSVTNDRWRDERRGLEKEIEAKRAERARNEFDQLRRTAKRAQQQRTRRFMIPMAAALSIIAMSVLYLRLRVLWVKFDRNAALEMADSAMLIGGVALIVVLVAVLLAYFRVFESSAMQAACGNVETLDELDQIRLERGAWRRVKHPNPQVRYVAWHNMRFDDGDILPYDLDHFQREQLSLVRRAAARAFLTAKAVPSYPKLFEINEFAYVVERGKVKMTEAPRPMLLVSRIAAAHDGGSYEPVFDLLTPGLAGVLAKNFVNNRTTGIDYIGRQTCRTALALLSPEEDGIGTFDHLKCVDTVDELFFYFRRELYFGDRGVADTAVPETTATSPQ